MPITTMVNGFRYSNRQRPLTIHHPLPNPFKSDHHWVIPRFVQPLGIDHTHKNAFIHNRKNWLWRTVDLVFHHFVVLSQYGNTGVFCAFYESNEKCLFFHPLPIRTINKSIDNFLIFGLRKPYAVFNCNFPWPHVLDGFLIGHMP